MTLRRLRASREEQVATKIAELLEPVTMNLDEVGKSLARMSNIHYNRLMLIAEAAEWEKENYYNQQVDTLF